MIGMSRKPRRRDPKMTAIITGTAITELITVLNWLSQYSGGSLRGMAGASTCRGGALERVDGHEPIWGFGSRRPRPWRS
jgi:hypothetical protein